MAKMKKSQGNVELATGGVMGAAAAGSAVVPAFVACSSGGCVVALALASAAATAAPVLAVGAVALLGVGAYRKIRK